MPVYDFECQKCKHAFDKMYSSYKSLEEDRANITCPKCNSKKVEKTISKGTSFILKGSGWTGKLKK